MAFSRDLSWFRSWLSGWFLARVPIPARFVAVGLALDDGLVGVVTEAIHSRRPMEQISVANYRMPGRLRQAIAMPQPVAAQQWRRSNCHGPHTVQPWQARRQNLPA